MCDGNGFFLTLSKTTFFLVSAGHKDCIVNSSSQLDTTDNNACYEHHFLSLIIRNGHIDKNRKLNNCNQNKRKRNGFKHNHDNNENCQDRDSIYSL